MKRIYMYPKNDYETLESPNPYVLNLEQSLSENHEIVNKRPNRIGVFELFLFLFKADVFFFNWIEDIPHKRFGKLQTVAFPLFLLFVKILRKKVFWVLHNKYSHEKKLRFWSDSIFNEMVRYSDVIITHSGEGIEFLKSNFPGQVQKARYVTHPIEPMLVFSQKNKKYDLLIWGTIHEYKGVIDFLSFIRDNKGFMDKRILISGICPDVSLRSRLIELLTENITYINEFQSIEKIASLAAESKYILFTYTSDSILSSGSLMDSIRMGSIVIGPAKGAFEDLKNYSFIRTYKSFDEIPGLIKNSNLQNDENALVEMNEFCNNNSWAAYSMKLRELSNGIL